MSAFAAVCQLVFLRMAYQDIERSILLVVFKLMYGVGFVALLAYLSMIQPS